MSGTTDTIRLTMTQALVRYLAAQYIEIEGERVRLCAGGFGIFGHGNVTCLGEALYAHREELPLFRGQNEQSMAHAAIAYAKQKLRRRFMLATASAGPGTTNMVTAAALAHTNRLPILFLCGDTFITRLPDPVLQQIENFNDPTLSVNDAFKSVTRFWDRITHPAQIIHSLPNAIATMLDPADCGPAFIGLPQDVQGWAYDYPLSFFDEKVHRIRQQPADQREIDDAVAAIAAAKRPIIIAGGGVQYSGATAQLQAFAEKHHIPVVETIAGRANLLHTHELNCGPIGVTGSNSANYLAEHADLVLAVGTRLQDFTTGSWTAFAQDAKLVSINVGRFDAGKHLALPIVGDAKLCLPALSEKLNGYKADQNWVQTAGVERTKWDAYVDENIEPKSPEGNTRPMSYAQIVGAVNRLCDDDDRIVAAAGGLPAEVTANWRTKSISSIDVEFGFSCMGYEIAGGWGARIAQTENSPENDTIVFAGDGSYLIMNSDIYSSVLTDKKMILIVCDNGGFAVINKLQNNTGNASFNNLIEDSNIVGEPFSVDFEAHARAMGATAETVQSMDDFDAAFARAKASDRTYVICMKVDPYEGWTKEGHAWWEVGTPEISNDDKVRTAHQDWESTRHRQRRGV
ncbi:3D-(3,5/4)-trihydroxycyclohexane-1,2-dione acylhydrolase (decyclizing) [Maritalea sp.]|jgi:3D-(3,5/4)-trihydroxycyclohexane-1,2-dione acylhydrolase (decyclizing)|uniref:3D-(3,5/4)-trihydroxycyclohexane-1,2-dione acylhydrolase (decyclizing) n=1 Tax=Maritalea sp. TaxID=2003361 RepID=UPI0039E4CEBE